MRATKHVCIVLACPFVLMSNNVLLVEKMATGTISFKRIFRGPVNSYPRENHTKPLNQRLRSF
jgi:hypothetical protein